MSSKKKNNVTNEFDEAQEDIDMLTENNETEQDLDELDEMGSLDDIDDIGDMSDIPELEDIGDIDDIDDIENIDSIADDVISYESGVEYSDISSKSRGQSDVDYDDLSHDKEDKSLFEGNSLLTSLLERGKLKGVLTIDEINSVLDDSDI